MNKSINKKDLPVFFKQIAGGFTIIGPVKRGNLVVFDKITSFEQLELERRTDYSFRKWFLPNKEVMFEFNGTKVGSEVKQEKRIMIIRPCDANALLLLDRIFLDKHCDSYYKNLRDNTIIFVFQCTKPEKNCFCTSMHTDKTNNFDLKFIDIGDRYLVEMGRRGSELVASKLFGQIMREGESKIKCERNIVIPPDFYSKFNHPAWEKHSKECLYCCACLAVCPTCHCFEMYDDVNIDLKSGKRERDWHFCYLKDFTRVAGGHVFRDDPKDRYRNRFYCKLKYLKDRYGKEGCVGCGRCIDICPAELDMIKHVADLSEPIPEEKPVIVAALESKPADKIVLTADTTKKAVRKIPQKKTSKKTARTKRKK